MLKKVGIIGTILPVFFILTACNSTVASRRHEPVLEFSAKICIATGEQFVEGILKSSNNSGLEFCVTSPEQINGLVLKKINSENAVSFKGLEMKTNENKLPDSSFFLVLGEVLESLGDNNNYNFISTENTISTLSGKCKTSGNYEVQIYDSSGYIKEIKVPSKNLVISFSEFKENG